MDQVKINDLGGVIPASAAERARAKASDLGTLPPELPGTSCANCEYFSAHNNEIGFCTNKSVQQYVTVRMCCYFWNNPGYLRAADTR